MVHLGPKHPQHRKGTLRQLPQDLKEALDDLEKQLYVTPQQLKDITEHFIGELDKGLSKKGGNIPMIPTWVMDYPTGKETGDYLAIDLGGTNLRVVLVKLTGDRKFDTTQSKFALPKGMRTAHKDELWDFIAKCLKEFVDELYPSGCDSKLPLGFTFSYPASQKAINSGVLQRWTKGWDIHGIEGHDVVPMLQDALVKVDVPIKVVALINDTTGTLVASMYTDPEAKMGVIFGTGCNGAYYEVVNDIPKLEGITPSDIAQDSPIAINCEYGAFDNEHKVLPRTKYDIQIDKDSPRPNQQSFEKMIAGYYLGEVLRLIILDLVDRGLFFKNQDSSKLREPFLLDASVPSQIEEDPFENLSDTEENFKERFGIETTESERQVIVRLAQLIGERAARLSICGIAAVCKKRGYTSGHMAADGSVYKKYPYFKERAAQGLRDILDWTDKEDPITIVPAEDGSGAGAAIIAALTEERLKRGLSVGTIE